MGKKTDTWFLQCQKMKKLKELRQTEKLKKLVKNNKDQKVAVDQAVNLLENKVNLKVVVLEVEEEDYYKHTRVKREGSFPQLLIRDFSSIVNKLLEMFIHSVY